MVNVTGKGPCPVKQCSTTSPSAPDPSPKDQVRTPVPTPWAVNVTQCGAQPAGSDHVYTGTSVTAPFTVVRAAAELHPFWSVATTL